MVTNYENFRVNSGMPRHLVEIYIIILLTNFQLNAFIDYLVKKLLLTMPDTKLARYIYSLKVKVNFSDMIFLFAIHMKVDCLSYLSFHFSEYLSIILYSFFKYHRANPIVMNEFAWIRKVQIIYIKEEPTLIPEVYSFSVISV